MLHGMRQTRSSLDQPGIDIKEGSYMLAVNGMPITTEQEPYAFFQGLDKKTVELTYNSTPSFAGAKTAIVQTMDNEYQSALFGMGRSQPQKG